VTDKAVIVAINSYPGAPLSGCLNDAQDAAEELVSAFGFKSAAIRLLVEKRATAKAILERLRWLARDAKPGDRLLFWYSGHGAQVADQNGDEVKGMDDVICPVDFNWEEPRLIRDDTFYEIFKTIPDGVHFAWVSDSCHSGTLTREFEPPAKKTSAKKAPKPKILGERFMPAPVDHAWSHRVARDLGHKPKPIAMSAPQINVAFISGCRDNQTSADANFGGRPNGALSYFLLKNLKAHKDAPVTALVDAVRADLKKNGYSQVPQIDGKRIGLPFLG